MKIEIPVYRNLDLILYGAFLCRPFVIEISTQSLNKV